jgi:hypothetical protein
MLYPYICCSVLNAGVSNVNCFHPPGILSTDPQTGYAPAPFTYARYWEELGCWSFNILQWVTSSGELQLNWKDAIKTLLYGWTSLDGYNISISQNKWFGVPEIGCPMTLIYSILCFMCLHN